MTGYDISDESSKMKHDAAGLLTMAIADRDSRGSLFNVTLGANRHLDRSVSLKVPIFVHPSFQGFMSTICSFRERNFSLELAWTGSMLFLESLCKEVMC